MILYFSATGNSEYVARRIAAETGDIAVSITDCYKKQIFSFDEKCKTLSRGERLRFQRVPRQARQLRRVMRPLSEM